MTQCLRHKVILRLCEIDYMHTRSGIELQRRHATHQTPVGTDLTELCHCLWQVYRLRRQMQQTNTQKSKCDLLRV